MPNLTTSVEFPKRDILSPEVLRPEAILMDQDMPAGRRDLKFQQTIIFMNQIPTGLRFGMHLKSFEKKPRSLNIRTWFFIFFLTIFFQNVYSLPTLNDLLKTEVQTKYPLVYFKQDESRSTGISMLELRFLEAWDCYSGFLAQFNASTSGMEFTVEHAEVFSIDGKAVFNAIYEKIHPGEVEKVHSLLLRIITSGQGNGYERFAWFSGSCQDQGINCCIPIVCSEKTSLCSTKYEMELQPIKWHYWR